MTTIKIDGQDYELEKLTDEAKAQIASIQAADHRLEELKRDSAFVMTARSMYVQGLKNSLNQLSPAKEPEPVKSEKSGKPSAKK